MLNKSDIISQLPNRLHNSITDSFVYELNNLSKDPDLSKSMRDNFINHLSIIKEGKYSLEDYMSAIKYVSYKLLDYTQLEAYKKTFPERYEKLVLRGKGDSVIGGYASAYNKTLLVNKIMEQTLVPSWILNQDIYQKAINTQYEIMTDTSVSARERVNAANSILTHLGKPKDSIVQLDLGASESVGLKEMRDAITELAQIQKAQIVSGTTKTIDIAGKRLIPPEEVIINAN